MPGSYQFRATAAKGSSSDDSPRFLWALPTVIVRGHMSEADTKTEAPSESETSTANGTTSNPPPADAAPAAEAPAAEGAAPPGPEAPDPLEVAKADAAKYREQLLRTAADFDNYRKRARREQEDAQRRGKETTLKELLPVFDNLERAMASADTAPDVKSVADGLRMVGRQFTSTLERIGIKRIQAIGQPFDPSLHEAIQHIESSEHPAGVIAAEVQAGYMLNDHLVRAALVAVSKGPPAAPAESADAAPAAAADPAAAEPAKSEEPSV